MLNQIHVELIAITPDSEKVIEKAGRTCYKSVPTNRLNGRRRFIRNIVQKGHHSVLEHGYATFRVTGASRSFTHQLVRHRLCAFSQQSQRYVDEKKFAFVEPQSIANNSQAHDLFQKFMVEAKNAYSQLQAMDIKNEDARFILPNAVQSEIVLSANFREFRHIFSVRCDKHAQWEIRNVALQMLRILKEEAPSVFADFVIDEATGTAYTTFLTQI